MEFSHKIHEVLDFNEIMNQDILPEIEESLELGKTVDIDYIFMVVEENTIGYDLWQETDDAWWHQIYIPAFEYINQHFNLGY